MLGISIAFTSSMSSNAQHNKKFFQKIMFFNFFKKVFMVLDIDDVNAIMPDLHTTEYGSEIIRDKEIDAILINTHPAGIL